jgi:hypothetical protein
MRTRARVDANQAEIVRALVDEGCSVVSMAAVGRGWISYGNQIQDALRETEQP